MSTGQNIKVGDRVSLSIEKLSFGDGDGIARIDKLVVFVPLSAPGDLVEAEIIFKKKNFARAKLLKVSRPGSSRRDAPCSVYGSCGGCQWQHIQYEDQVAIKGDLLKEAFDRAKLRYRTFSPIVASPNEFRYRNRVQVQLSSNGFGFRARKSHNFVQTEDCLIAQEPLIALIKSSNKRLRGRHEVFLSEDGSVHLRSTSEEAEGNFFAQVNNDMNNLLKEWVREFVPSNSQRVWDLYGGNGNFSLDLARRLKKAEFVCVDSNQNNIASGIRKAEALSFSHVKFKAQLTHEFLADESTADLCIVDPPRAGLDRETIGLLMRCDFRRLIYISCDPMTLIRDLKAMQSQGFQILEVRPLDMFPQTHHVETFVVVERHSDA
ncbi:MAG: class I SAM-dependent RNA methyltransferase [Pseudomonadota bacterium]